MQVVDLGGDALQCSSVITHGQFAIRGFKELIKIIPSYIRIRPPRASSMRRCFDFFGQLPLYR
ncbi:hypothetical protein XpruCFBP8354_05705 [Xanthomonas prunicola]|uniref:Uncharacterized protein n=1 Tax=Xanthomonas prunicola TaxID=2053930 RepID=A0A2N3RPY8_9XANT|nr:hypothetical protein XpruCFBP8353_05705 [Xanthomonas prunicola]PKV18813.1 hypothetical protein XpruCFBP8354_05705 [Xanthomonas prunicola]